MNHSLKRKRNTQMGTPSSRQNMIIEELRIIQEDIKSISSQQPTQKAILERIEAQVLKTNGRVTALEQSDNQTKGSIRMLSWVVGIFISLIPIIFTMHQLFIKK